MYNSLEEIIIKYGLNGFWIDGGGTDKVDEHSYTPYYNKIFSPFREKECHILEIGTWTGAFLFAMAKFMPKATFVTLDIQQKFSDRILLQLGPNKTTNHQLVNAYTFETLKLIEDQQFDFIIDDGTHIVSDGLFVFYHYMKLLKPDGKMVIEDLDENAVKLLLPHVDPKQFTITIVDGRAVKNRGDDMLVEITRN